MNEWPPVLTSTTAVPIKEIHPHMKSARFLDIQISQRNPSLTQNDTAFKTMVLTLSKAQQSMVIQLSTKTIFLFASNSDPNKKLALLAAVVPKVVLPRPPTASESIDYISLTSRPCSYY